MPDTPIDQSESISSIRLKIPTGEVPIPPEGWGQLHSPAPGELAIRLPDGSVVAVGGGGAPQTALHNPYGSQVNLDGTDPTIGVLFGIAPGQRWVIDPPVSPVDINGQQFFPRMLGPFDIAFDDPGIQDGGTLSVLADLPAGMVILAAYAFGVEPFTTALSAPVSLHLQVGDVETGDLDDVVVYDRVEEMPWTGAGIQKAYPLFDGSVAPQSPILVNTPGHLYAWVQVAEAEPPHVLTGGAAKVYVVARAA